MRGAGWSRRGHGSGKPVLRSVQLLTTIALVSAPLSIWQAGRSRSMPAAVRTRAARSSGDVRVRRVCDASTADPRKRVCPGERMVSDTHSEDWTAALNAGCARALSASHYLQRALVAEGVVLALPADRDPAAEQGTGGAARSWLCDLGPSALDRRAHTGAISARPGRGRAKCCSAFGEQHRAKQSQPGVRE